MFTHHSLFLMMIRTSADLAPRILGGLNLWSLMTHILQYTVISWRNDNPTLVSFPPSYTGVEITKKNKGSYATPAFSFHIFNWIIVRYQKSRSLILRPLIYFILWLRPQLSLSIGRALYRTCRLLHISHKNQISRHSRTGNKIKVCIH